MDKIIWYNHTFSSTNIKPAFIEPEIVGSTIYYAHYFVLYPTGLAIILTMPYELASISYNPYSNYFTTSDSLSSGMVKLASITPKIYQFVGASQILVSAGAWSNTRSNASDSVHYKWYYTSNNPISLNTSTKRIVWQGIEYGSLPEMLFIDPALWMWQELAGNTVDVIRYPLYKRNNLYYKSTTTLYTDAQYLSVASDAFSHSDSLSNLSQSWTKGYASRNKLGIILNTTTLNPQVPSSNSTFSQATTTNNTKDVYQIDNSRFMTEKFGIKDGNKSYQLSVAPSIYNAGGYYLGMESQSKVTYPITQCSRSNPWILGRYEGVQVPEDDIFFIDQFVLQIKNNQFKIPLNWTVKGYYRQATNPQITVAKGWNRIETNGKVMPSEFGTFTYFMGAKSNTTNTITATAEISNTYVTKLYSINRNTNQITNQTTSWPTQDFSKTVEANIDLFMHVSDGMFDMGVRLRTCYYDMAYVHQGYTFKIEYTLKNVPLIPNVPNEYNKLPVEPSTQGCSRSDTTQCLWNNAKTSSGNWDFIHYMEQHGGAFGSNRVLGGIIHNFTDNNGMCGSFLKSFISDNSSTMKVFIGDTQYDVLVDQLDTYDNDQAGATLQTICESNGSLLVWVTYPEN